jgi:hypothetical protein
MKCLLLAVAAFGGLFTLVYSAFANNSGATFSVLTATKPSLPSRQWTVVRQALEITLGQHQFTDPQTGNNLTRFYRVSPP